MEPLRALMVLSPGHMTPSVAVCEGIIQLVACDTILVMISELHNRDQPCWLAEAGALLRLILVVHLHKPPHQAVPLHEVD